MTIDIEKSGRRYYLIGNTYAVKDTLRGAGCNWDADRKCWWTGKVEVAQQIQAQLARQSDEGQTVGVTDDARVLCKVKYTSKAGKIGTYYAVAETRDGAKWKLTILDGSISFWADRSACQVVKTYTPREHTYRGHTRTEYTTLGSISRFVERVKRDEQAQRDGTAETKRCWECGCQFTELDARRNGGDWSDSYCGC